MNFEEIKLDLLELNVGQIEGLPGNPRKISAEKLELLKKDIHDYPELLEMRGLIVYPHNNKYVLIGGNMRYKAMMELGYDTAPCIVVPKNTSVEKLKAYTILDNAPFGEWDWEALSNDWDEASLMSWGLTMQEFEKEETKETKETLRWSFKKERGVHAQGNKRKREEARLLLHAKPRGQLATL